MKTALALALAFTVIGCAARSASTAAVYGSAPSSGTAPITLERALSDSNLGRAVAVEARVAEVCRMKGCWMVLTDGARSARVTFQDYAFFVPKDLAGKTVVAYGTLSRRLLSADEAEHLDRESGSPTTSVPAPREEWSLVATSVVVPAGRQLLRD
jgi:hypothetical protein